MRDMQTAKLIKIGAGRTRGAMDYQAYFTGHLDHLRDEGRYRVFAELERIVGAFPRARFHQDDKVRDVMRLNHYLGQLVGNTMVFGEYSFNFALFGEPSPTQPWGWQLQGHHLALNCLVINGQLVLTPTFMGAEPNYADEGKYKGIRLFQDEEHLVDRRLQPVHAVLPDAASASAGGRVSLPRVGLAQAGASRRLHQRLLRSAAPGPCQVAGGCARDLRSAGGRPQRAGTRGRPV